MASIFHYTDASGLVGILQSKSLFATHYRCLNDLTEAAIINDLLKPILEAEIADITPKLIKLGWLKQEFYGEYGKAGHQMQADAMLSSITTVIDRVSPFFVISFCRHPPESDDFKHGLLSQWRGYSDGGGFAIEFDEDAIDAAMNAENDKFVYGASKTSDVYYSEFEKVFDPEKFKGLAGAMIAHLFGKRDISDVTGRKSIDEAVRDFVHAAPFLKHPGFSEEKEYRMVLAPVRKTKVDAQPKFKGSVKPVKFRVRRGSVVPYIEVTEFQDVLPIKSIVVGPHSNQEMQRDAVEMLLETTGHRADTRLSAIPFLSTRA
jgi:hypothetical protein